MKELTMKEKIDKVIDKRIELMGMEKEFVVPFSTDCERVCLLRDSELEYYSKVLGQDIVVEVFADNRSEEHSHIKYFFYRGFRFYFLVERKVDK